MHDRDGLLLCRPASLECIKGPHDHLQAIVLLCSDSRRGSKVRHVGYAEGRAEPLAIVTHPNAAEVIPEVAYNMCSLDKWPRTRLEDRSSDLRR